ncbi:MAG: hypothetical protein LBM95_05880 [Lactobacillales bacterium]|nr:hypothetical protein [Lactobacillales bacterium]
MGNHNRNQNAGFYSTNHGENTRQVATGHTNYGFNHLPASHKPQHGGRTNYGSIAKE